MKITRFFIILFLLSLGTPTVHAQTNGLKTILLGGDILQRSELVYEKGPAKIYKIPDDVVSSILPEPLLPANKEAAEEYPNVVVLNAEVDGTKKDKPDDWLIFDTTRNAKFYAPYIQYKKDTITITVFVSGKKHKTVVSKAQKVGVYLFVLNGPKYKKGLYPCLITLKLKTDKKGVGETCVFWVVPESK